MAAGLARQEIRLVVATLLFALFRHGDIGHNVEFSAEVLGGGLREDIAKARAAALTAVKFVVQQRIAHRALIAERGEARADLRALMERRFAVGERLFALRTHAVNAGFSTEGTARWKK